MFRSSTFQVQALNFEFLNLELIVLCSVFRILTLNIKH